jgi:hypothetical protein
MESDIYTVAGLTPQSSCHRLSWGWGDRHAFLPYLLRQEDHNLLSGLLLNLDLPILCLLNSWGYRYVPLCSAFFLFFHRDVKAFFSYCYMLYYTIFFLFSFPFSFSLFFSFLWCSGLNPGLTYAMQVLSHWAISPSCTVFLMVFHKSLLIFRLSSPPSQSAGLSGFQFWPGD